MKRAHVARLREMLREIDLVADMIEGVDLSVYSRDKKLRRAVERCVEIVSEASRRLPPELKERERGNSGDWLSPKPLILLSFAFF